MSDDAAVLAELVERVRVDGTVVGASIATPGQRRVVQQFESGSGEDGLINGGVAGETGS